MLRRTRRLFPIEIRTRVLGAVQLGVEVNHFIGQQFAASIYGALGVLGVVIIVTAALRELALVGVDEIGGRGVVVGVQRLHVLERTLSVSGPPPASRLHQRSEAVECGEGPLWTLEGKVQSGLARWFDESGRTNQHHGILALDHLLAKRASHDRGHPLTV